MCKLKKLAQQYDASFVPINAKLAGPEWILSDYYFYGLDLNAE